MISGLASWKIKGYAMTLIHHRTIGALSRHNTHDRTVTMSQNERQQSSDSNGSGLPRCGPGLEPDRMVQSSLLSGKQGYMPGSGTCSNRTAVPFYSSYHFGSN